MPMILEDFKYYISNHLKDNTITQRTKSKSLKSDIICKDTYWSFHSYIV